MIYDRDQLRARGPQECVGHSGQLATIVYEMINVRSLYWGNILLFHLSHDSRLHQRPLYDFSKRLHQRSVLIVRC